MKTTFPTTGPIDLYVEVGKGSVTLSASDVAETVVEVSGPRADEVLVELDDHRLAIVAPRSRGGFLGGDADVVVRASLPEGSSLVSRTGSADLTTTGTWRLVQVKAGSGRVDLDTVEGPGQVEVGSGDVRVARLDDTGRIKSGSGEVAVGFTAGGLSVSSGSGAVSVDDVAGPLTVKTGSGDLRLGRTCDRVQLTTASGHVHLAEIRRGELSARTASGHVVIGVPAGVPVWTDITSAAGRVRSDLRGAGEPAPGQDHVELRISTASGDVALRELAADPPS